MLEISCRAQKLLVCHNTEPVSKAFCINALPGLNLLHEPNAVITVCVFFVFGYCLSVFSSFDGEVRASYSTLKYTTKCAHINGHISPLIFKFSTNINDMCVKKFI